MDSLDLLGAVGARILSDELDRALTHPEAGTARFLLDRLQKDQTVAIVSAVLKDAALASRVFVAVPAAVAHGSGLPAHVVTNQRAVHFRNRPAPQGKSALLLVNTDDDQGVSLQDMTRLGAKMLSDRVDVWVDVAGPSLPLPESDYAVWKAALRGLTDAHSFTVGQLAKYVAAVAERIGQESQPLQATLGYCLPILHVPRDSTLAIAEKQQRHRSAWKRKFEQLVHERAPLLRKQTKSRQLLEREELSAQFKRVRDDIDSRHWPTIEAFIESPQTWNPTAQALAELEWDTDKVDQLFTGLKTKRVSLAQETLEFYRDKDESLLDDADREHLELLLEQTKKQPNDEDRDFYENHRSLIAERPALKAKWDRFIFGVSIECHDLLVGLLSALHRLKSRVPNWAGRKRIRIEWNARGRTQHLAVNADVATLFCLRYRGLQALFGSKVEWQVDPLFDYMAFLDSQKGQKRYQRNESTARTALRIRLDVRLLIGDDEEFDEHAVQLEYIGRPEAVSSSLPDDLNRLCAKPFAELSVQRVRASKKGQAQRIALEDSGSFEAAYGLDAGSFVPAVRDIKDFDKDWSQALERCRSRIAEQDVDEIRQGWSEFKAHYKHALEEYRAVGIGAPSQIQQAQAYATLIERLESHSRDDVIRRELLAPLLRLGVVIVQDEPAAAVITPWNPMRLAALATKARSVGRLFQHMLDAEEIEVGDERLFFRELAQEIAHPYYPEIAVGYASGDPILLVVTDSLDDYSLAEEPVNSRGIARTNEDPAEGAARVRDVVARYLELQPHENASLSVALFECDSAGLPLAAVGALSTLQESEMHCNVTLRHRDRRALQRVYNDLLEQSDADPDALVASETSRNFMAKLRVGIHVEPPGSVGASDCRQVDIAYLQDVVARRARIQWLQTPTTPTSVSLLGHVPPRWAYKAPTTSESATRYLTCPEQPAEGWAYVAAVAAVIERQPNASGHRRLPVRTISLSDGAIKQAFGDAHNLAEWVVNYDDLLDPEQLRHQDIHVIRYQKDKSNGRNIIVSSTSRSRVLEVLLRRRLESLGLGLQQEAIDHLVTLLISQAVGISGEIVLRASKRGVSAGELIGIVLSAALIREELGRVPTACFFLDDYASWLGQQESGIADLLFISFDPLEPARIRVVVSEAKYIGSRNASDARKTSRRQVEATVSRINDALFENPGRLDRDLWLSRLSDLLLDAVKSPKDQKLFDKVRRSIRDGAVEIDLRGYSHVFVTDQEQGVLSDQERLPDRCGPHSVQEVFSLEHTRELLRALATSSPLSDVRHLVGDEIPWAERTWRPPAGRAEWIESALSTPPPSTQSPPNPPSKIVPPAGVGDKQPATLAFGEAGEPPKPPNVPRGTGPTPVLSLDAMMVSKAGAATADDTSIAWLESASKALQRALVGWGFQAKILGTRLTPNAGLVRLLGSDRLETKDVENNRQRLLTTHSLNVISITPRPGEIVVAIERSNRQIVSLWDVWKRIPSRRGPGLNFSFVVGVRELDGEPLLLNLGDSFNNQPSHAPHTLIAGTTGSGKSILIQNLMLDIALTNSSSLAKIYCVDPKMGVDYVSLDGLPHLSEGIIVEQERAIVVLEQLVLEMDARYKQFAEARVPNLRGYNEKAPQDGRLPAIFLVHDEFAEWMLTDEYKEKVSATVKRLGVKARAAGIHLFFAAQRPDKDVMPPQLRDNLGNRLILRVEGEGTSEIALGQKGAERLLGKGHCAARLQNEADLIYAQVPWLSPGDVEEVVATIRKIDLEAQL